eukprot:NODE_5787_length_611_cov_9.838843_g5623_i0.p1 GENE.NODE_5787_length_611_cov_9.838843_g5623_i0~~NODE_5787_length_611_cov_9.838843_g5623_i0.p1  ORF type:complete len:203 (-),score=53.39 NODE_5787_length_611_cov_9.838843_g5623_i0:3-575(-)
MPPRKWFSHQYDPLRASQPSGRVGAHDRAVLKALVAHYTPPSLDTNPHLTLFVSHLNRSTSEATLCRHFAQYGKAEVHLVRHLLTGASQGYCFVTYPTQRMRDRCYQEAHDTWLEGWRLCVDYERAHCMPGWVPRRLGGGFGGRKQSGQLRFGCRTHPFLSVEAVPGCSPHPKFGLIYVKMRGILFHMCF